MPRKAPPVTPGEQIGGWTVVSETEPGSPVWTVRCGCGWTTQRHVVRLRSCQRRAEKAGTTLHGCGPCAHRKHSAWMRENGRGFYSLSMRYGYRAACGLQDRVDIDAELPDRF